MFWLSLHMRNPDSGLCREPDLVFFLHSFAPQRLNSPPILIRLTTSLLLIWHLLPLFIPTHLLRWYQTTPILLPPSTQHIHASNPYPTPTFPATTPQLTQRPKFTTATISHSPHHSKLALTISQQPHHTPSFSHTYIIGAHTQANTQTFANPYKYKHTNTLIHFYTKARSPWFWEH